MSEMGLPQSIIIDLGNIEKKTKFYQCFGVQCIHAYSSNPSHIELYVSKDGVQFNPWAVINLKFKEGKQLFVINPLGSFYKYLEIVVKDTFGAKRTYINQIFLLEKHPKQKYQTNSPYRSQNMPRQVQNKQSSGHKQENQRYSSQFQQHRSSKVEEQFNQYLNEKNESHDEYISAIQKRGEMSSASKNTQTDEFVSRDYFSQQSLFPVQMTKATPNFQNQTQKINFKSPEFTTAQNMQQQEQYMEVFEEMQNNFNSLCGKLKHLQQEFEVVQQNFQQTIQNSHRASYMSQSNRKQRSKIVNSHLISKTPSEQVTTYRSQSQFGQQNEEITPRDDLRNEIMNQCMTFCQDKINQMTSARNSNKPFSVTSPQMFNQNEQTMTQASNQQRINEQEYDVLEERLKDVIEDWQKNFFIEYVQPSLNNIEDRILRSIEKKFHSQGMPVEDQQDQYEEVKEYQDNQNHQKQVYEQLEDVDQEVNYSQEEEGQYEGATEIMFQRLGSPKSPILSDQEDQSREFLKTRETFAEEGEQQVSDIKQIAKVLEQKLALKAQKLQLLEKQQQEQFEEKYYIDGSEYNESP